MGFFHLDNAEDRTQMTLDQLLAEKAKAVVRDEISTALRPDRADDRGYDRIDRVESAAKNHVDNLRDAIGSLAKLKPLERYALVTLARMIAAKRKTKRSIKREVNRLLE